ncbi:MAG: hypothetical protein JWO42_2460 [Chloroflexi bacterium]|nr:hypothetical protein [Chloroflexota bacterium]
MNDQNTSTDIPHSSPAIEALIANTAIVIPTYWGRSFGLRRPGDSIEDHPTPVNQSGTMGRLLRSLQALKEKPRLVLILISSSAPDVATSAAWQVDFVREKYPDLPIALWLPTHVEILHGRLRSLGHTAWATWFGARDYPRIRNMQLLVPHLIDCDLVVALDDDEVVEDPYFLRRAAASVVDGASNGERVYGAASYYLDEHGYRMHEVTASAQADSNPFEHKITLMNGILERIEAEPGNVVRSTFALGGNMTFSRDLIRQVGFDPMISRGEDIDYVVNAALMGIPYHFDKNRPVRHLPPAGRSYKDFDYAKLQQDVRRFLYEREKLRAAAADGSFSALTTADLAPYPGAFLTGDLEMFALASLRIHRPARFDITMLEPERFVLQAAEQARQGAAAFLRFAREWPQAMEMLGNDHAIRHVARSILP